MIICKKINQAIHAVQCLDEDDPPPEPTVFEVMNLKAPKKQGRKKRKMTPQERGRKGGLAKARNKKKRK